ncbi:CCHC-type domain-containing protein [Trichonephila clavipes]|nr:CCHC-type domain-containing protein [Trichonephila clavipes]
MPTEQEAKPAVVTPSLQQWRSPSTFRGAPGEDPLKWLKEYDRVANFNKWDDMMCLANVYFFLDGTARQWYVNNEDALDSWEAFKNGLSGLFGDRQKYTRRAEEQLKCRAQRSGESTQSYIQSVLGLCQEVNPLMREDEKVSHLMKGVAEDIYQALLTREINDTASFIKWCNYIEDMKQKRVGRPRFERLPNVVPVASLTDETDLVSLIRTIVREEVHRLVNQTQESLDSDPQSLEEIVKTKLKRRVLAQCQQNKLVTNIRRCNRKLQRLLFRNSTGTKADNVWRTADNRPVVFHTGRLYVIIIMDIITVSGYQTRGDINVVLDGSKHFALREILLQRPWYPQYRNGKVMSGLPTCGSKPNHPRGMCIGQAEPLNEGASMCYFRHIGLLG